MQYKPQKPKSAFEQWNMEKTQPNRNASNFVGGGGGANVGWKWNSYPATANVDKSTDRGYNKVAEWDRTNYGDWDKSHTVTPILSGNSPGEKEDKPTSIYDSIHSDMKRYETQTPAYRPGEAGIKKPEKLFLSADEKKNVKFEQLPYKPDEHRGISTPINYKASDGVMSQFKTVSYNYNPSIYGTENESKDKGKKEKATEVVRENAGFIKQASEKYGVDPLILTACIYGEQAKNVNWTDAFDVFRNDSKTSLGVAQVQIGTALALDDSGYIDEPIQYLGKTEEWHGNGMVMKDMWFIPGYGNFIGTKNKAMHLRLSMPGQSIEYAAAYLAQLSDAWRKEYPPIDTDVGILTTLYNIGYRKPHGNPENGIFGDFVMKNYEYIKYLTDTYVIE